MNSNWDPFGTHFCYFLVAHHRGPIKPAREPSEQAMAGLIPSPTWKSISHLFFLFAWSQYATFRHTTSPACFHSFPMHPREAHYSTDCKETSQSKRPTDQVSPTGHKPMVTFRWPFIHDRIPSFLHEHHVAVSIAAHVSSLVYFPTRMQEQTGRVATSLPSSSYPPATLLHLSRDVSELLLPFFLHVLAAT